MKRITYDLHIHSCLSPCGSDDSTPANIVGMAIVAGLDAIAITDHNSCLNVSVAMELGEAYGVTVIPGMELTTSEEVHVLCYFKELEKAMAFSRYVSENTPAIQNKPEFFGHQLIVDSDDNVIREENQLLTVASNISFDYVQRILNDYDGLMVPAHINKATTSLISNLGMLPENPDFTAVEIQTTDKIPELTEKYPYLQKCHILTSSDAHYLKDIQNPVHVLHAEENTAESIVDALSCYIQ